MKIRYFGKNKVLPKTEITVSLKTVGIYITYSVTCCGLCCLWKKVMK